MTDADYLEAWHQVVLPLAAEFQPDLVIILFFLLMFIIIIIIIIITMTHHQKLDLYFPPDVRHCLFPIHPQTQILVSAGFDPALGCPEGEQRVFIAFKEVFKDISLL